MRNFYDLLMMHEILDSKCGKFEVPVFCHLLLKS